jgi:hypothetical protein
MVPLERFELDAASCCHDLQGGDANKAAWQRHDVLPGRGSFEQFNNSRKAVKGVGPDNPGADEHLSALEHFRKVPLDRSCFRMEHIDLE